MDPDSVFHHEPHIHDSDDSDEEEEGGFQEQQQGEGLMDDHFIPVPVGGLYTCG